MDVSLLDKPDAKHQRMHRGYSVYSQQSLIEESILKEQCIGGAADNKRSRCLFSERKGSIYNSAKARISLLNSALIRRFSTRK